MLRWTIPFLIAIAAIGPAAAADEAVPRRGTPHAAKLPAAHPRPHYKFRMTVSRPAPPLYGHQVPYGRQVYVEDEPELLFTPTDGSIPYIPPLVRAPLLPGSSTLPGYYGSSHSYDYQGPYYGGPYVGYWDRLPYACGVYGYC